MVEEVAAIGVTDVAFELFEGTHAAIEYRYPVSLAYLARRLYWPAASRRGDEAKADGHATEVEQLDGIVARR